MKTRPLHIIILLFFGIILLHPSFIDAAKPKSKNNKSAKSSTPDTATLLQDAQTAFAEYRFDQAIQLLDQYAEAVQKSKSTTPLLYDSLYAKADLGSTMLGRVEAITIIDSITIDKDSFLKAYRLSPPSGYIADANALPADFPFTTPTSVYITESGDHMIWAAPSPNGSQLVQSNLLTDGSWESPAPLPGLTGVNSNANYPFLLPDGTTLYFAADGDDSLGGLDIFISRDNGNGFLQPQNIGMPYNSPANDYLLAIDELTGVGWWATDRNNIPGKVTIYVYIPQEMRISYPADSPDIASLAFISNIKATQTDPSTVANRLEAIQAIYSHDIATAEEFQIAMPDGTILTSRTQIASPKSQELLNQYLDADAAYKQSLDHLAELRAQYAAGHRENSAEILRLERRIDTDRQNVISRLNQFIKSTNNY